MTHTPLRALSDELLPEANASASGLARRMVTAGSAFQQLALRLNAGGEFPDHANPGQATLLVVEGSVRFIEIDSGREHALRSGDLITVPDVLHRVVADEVSLLLLSFAVLPS